MSCTTDGQRRLRRGVHRGAGGTKNYRGRGTMLRTRTVPIAPHVAKDESHVVAGEARFWAGLVSKIQAVEKLRRSGLGSEHARSVIKALKTVFAPRPRELAHQVGSARVQKVLSRAWKVQHVENWVSHADELLIKAQAEESIAEQRRRVLFFLKKFIFLLFLVEGICT